MPLIQFVISNDRHHAAMMLPVATCLHGEAIGRCSLLSLCEFRGLPTPEQRFRDVGVEVTRVLRHFFRPAGRKQGGEGNRHARGFARRLSWAFLLRPRLERALQARPDVAVLPNDVAFPYDRLVRMLHARSVPFVLMQEGIRFPLPAEAGSDRYGSGGAAAVAAWGEGSAAHFRSQGVASERIHVTGSHRFDHIADTDWGVEGRRLSERLGLPARNLLLLSNPIDDQGFCSTADKLRLLQRFVAAALPSLASRQIGLVIKLHGRESIADLEASLAPLGANDRIRVLKDVPLYPLFTLSVGAVVLASTVGLEALLFGLPLGVLEIPGHGFVHDYVQRGAGRPLAIGSSLPAQLEDWLSSASGDGPAARRYLDLHLATRTGAGERVADLVRQTIGRQ